MKGFKSFPEKTVLEFAPGVSVVVGPNGSGKSNITDAVLWALGEQSPATIRGSSMQDVISVGGKGVGARSSAEVEVILDNEDGQLGDDFSEISITRRLDRDGEGEYRLNGARCRLTDIVELLSDANLGRQMHSVISQGRVDSIVHSKPRERRLLIEEAAGLGKFRKRRRRSELKLMAARENLDRALDVEREARRRLRPLKQQANAAEIGARIERQELELKVLLVAEELRFGEDRLAAARQAAAAARKRRDQVEAELGEISRRRRAVEERFAERDRARTEAWGRLSGLRTAQEQLTVAGAALAERSRRLEARLEDLRLELAPLTLDLDNTGSAGERARRLTGELGEVEAGLAAAGRGLAAAGGNGTEAERLAALGEIRSGAERAITHARRAEGLLGETRRQKLGRTLEETERIATALTALIASVSEVGSTVRGRVERTEQRVVGGTGEGDEIAAELKRCSSLEAEIQARSRTITEEVTRTEVEAAHLGDRRNEAEAELERITELLGETPEPAEEPLDDEERARIDRRLANLARQRERIGPVNPLAAEEYQEALAYVEDLTSQREDADRAIRELERVIIEIDEEIGRAFDRTFEATATNFEQMISHLFPGGSGRLRSVGGEQSPARAGDGDAAEQDDAETGEDGDDERPAVSQEPPGVELEVNPRGKRMRKMSLMSGGEKAMTALAFVFAVFLARPSPFYILDEVEAALDDVNINRFLELVREYSDRTQFVIVTHQKLTMNAADVLYGVSMGDNGVTRVVSRRLPAESGIEDVSVHEAA